MFQKKRLSLYLYDIFKRIERLKSFESHFK